MFKKDFNKWNKQKKHRNDNIQAPQFEEGDVWYCAFGANVGFEQDGVGNLFLRPVAIVRKYNDSTFLGVPLSRTDKDGGYFYQFDFQDGRSTAILSQMKLMDAKRLEVIVGSLSKSRLEEIRKRLAILIWRGVSELLPSPK